MPVEIFGMISHRLQSEIITPTPTVFDLDFTASAGACVRVSPLVRRVVAPNPGPITFTGTCSYIVGNGRVAEPGLVGTAPGSGAIRIMPVSVCHQVSTMGQRFWPMTS